MKDEMNALLERLWNMRKDILEDQYNHNHRRQQLSLYVGRYEWDVFHDLAFYRQGNEVEQTRGTALPCMQFAIFGFNTRVYIVDEHEHLSWGYANAL